MQCQRAVGEIERARRQLERLHVCLLIGYLLVDGVSTRTRQHFFRNIEAEHLGGALLTRPTTEPAKTTAEVYHPQPLHFRQQGAQCWPLSRPLQTLDRPTQPAV